MNKFFMYKTIAIFFAVLLFTSCLEDKGNYTYGNQEIITIEGIPEQIAVLANAENIVITPTITSNLRGNIGNNHPDFEFSCERKEDDKWIEMCSSPDNKDINMLADIKAELHTCRYSVIDRNTGVRTSFLFYINATTVTTEGWILLCNEESTDNTRIDMLSYLSMDRILPAYNVVKFAEEIPELKNPQTITFIASRGSMGNKIVMTTETGAYIIPSAGNHYGFGEIQEVTAVNDLKISMFLAAPEVPVVKLTNVPCQWSSVPSHSAVIAVDASGNAYAWDHGTVGARFEHPINTSERGKAPEYKVSPYIGTSLERFFNLQTYGIALLYDIENKRFIGWNAEADNQGSKKQTCYPLSNPENKLFNVENTGMDLVCMLNTLNKTLCIMQDGSKRHIYSFNIQTKDFAHDACYIDIQAEHFTDASLFAPSSQYPVIYYAYRNKVYSYNYATGENKVAISLPENEEVTMIKFNRYDDPFSAGYIVTGGSNEEKQAFTARQNQLIVGSYNSSVPDDKGGTLRFYETVSPGVDLTLVTGWEYTGFAKIVDAVYKEVRR